MFWDTHGWYGATVGQRWVTHTTVHVQRVSISFRAASVREAEREVPFFLRRTQAQTICLLIKNARRCLFCPLCLISSQTSPCLFLLPVSDTPPSGDFMRASLAVVSARLPTFSCSELSAVAAALADLRYRPPDAWLLPFAEEARARLPGFELSHLGPLVYGMASLGTPLDDDWLEAFGRECVRKLGASREGESLGLMLWGMAMYDVMPDARKWWEPFYRWGVRSERVGTARGVGG